MQNFKSHFWYSKRQRNGILFLILLIVVLQGIYFLINSSNTYENTDVLEIDAYQKQIDSLKEIQLKNQKIKIFSFNPNYITDFKGYQLGMNTEEIDKLLTYRKSGKFINSAKDFQTITGINDSLFSKISPLFKFPEWINQKTSSLNNTSQKSKKTKRSYTIANHDINLVTADQLKKINGVGDKLAKRIIAYRELLQGFTINEQLYEVYYLDKEVANHVLENYWVKEKPLILKLNINKASFKEILHLPYLDYKLTKKIFNYRDINGDYTSLEDLKKIDSFPNNKFKRIALYLTVD